MRTPLAELIEQISAGTLKVQVGKIFRLDEMVEAHRCMGRKKWAQDRCIDLSLIGKLELNSQET